MIATTINKGKARVKETTEANLLGTTIDQSLSFKKHVMALCKKASQTPCFCSNITLHGS